MSIKFVTVCAALLGALFVNAAPAPTVEERSTTYSGKATYYYQQGAAGSCGNYNSDDAYIVALSPDWMDNGSYCGKKIQITNMGGGDSNNGKGKSVTVTVADTCPGCEKTHLDLSVAAFKSLTGGNLDPPGTFSINWHFS